LNDITDELQPGPKYLAVSVLALLTVPEVGESEVMMGSGRIARKP